MRHQKIQSLRRGKLASRSGARAKVRPNIEPLEPREMLTVSALSQYATFQPGGQISDVIVATTTDPADVNAVAGDFSITINTGSNGNLNGDAVAIGSGVFDIEVNGEVNNPGIMHLEVDITNTVTSTSTKVASNDLVTIPDPVVTSLPVSATLGSTPTSVEVGTFTTTLASADAGMFAATVNWGDGSTSAGTITQIGEYEYSVVATKSGPYTTAGAKYITLNVGVGSASAANTWTQVGSLIDKVELQGAATGADGTVYSLAGHDGTTSSTVNVAYKYNSATASWTDNGVTGAPVQQFGTTVGPNGLIYIIDGNQFGTGATNTSTTYNPSTPIFSSIANSPDSVMNVAAATGPDGNIYAIGGTISTSATADVSKYNPTTNTWSAAAPLPTAREMVGTVTANNGTIYAIGGETDYGGETAVSAEVDAYDVSTNTWTTVAPLPVALTKLSVATGPDGNIYAMGGDSSLAVSVNKVYSYNTTTGLWSQVASMPVGLDNAASTLGGDGQIYEIGGHTSAYGGISSAIFTYNAVSTAGSNTYTLLIPSSAPTVYWPTPAAITYGTPLSATQLNATASVPGTFTYSPPLGTILGAAEDQILTVTFTPTDSTDYSPVTEAVLLDVNPQVAQLDWPNPTSIVYGTPLSSTQLDASTANNTITGTFTYTPASGTVLSAGNHALYVVFTPTDSTDYATEEARAAIVVTQATPVITWANPADITYNTPLSATQLDASTTILGTWTYTPPIGTVLSGGVPHQLSVTFTPTDTTDYATTTASVFLNVNFGNPVVTPTTLTTTVGQAITDVTVATFVDPTYPSATNTSFTASITWGDGDVSSGTITGPDVNGMFTVTGTKPNPYALSGNEPIQVTVTATGQSYQVWTQIASLNDPRANLAAGVDSSGSMYAIGGWDGNNSSSVEKYDAITNTWSYVAPLPTPVENMSAASTEQGIYVVGGDQDINGTYHVTGDVYNYNPALNLWTTVASLTNPRDSIATATDPSGGIFAVGGWNGTTDTTEVDYYSQTTKTWSTLAPLPVPLEGAGAYFSPADDDYLYVAGGYSQQTNQYSNQIFELDLTTDTWTTLPFVLPEPTAYFAVPGYVGAPEPIAIGGENSNGYLDKTSIFSSLFVTLPEPIGDNAASFALSTQEEVGLYTVGGYTTGDAYANNYQVTTADPLGSATTPATVNKITPVITWANPADILVGTPLSATQLDATTTMIPGTFVYTPALGTYLNGGQDQTLSVTFTPTNTSVYASVTQTATINVTKLTPIINWAEPTAISYGTALSATQLNATCSNTVGTFVYTPALGTVLTSGSDQTLSVTFTPVDTNDFSSITTTVSITVNVTNLTITWSTPDPINYLTALTATQLDASVISPVTETAVPGTFTYTPTLGAVLAGGPQTLSVTFAPTDTTDYAMTSSTASIVLQVNYIAPVISLEPVGSVAVGVPITNAPIATFTDANYPDSVPADYTVTVNWGDGETSPGTITGPNVNGVFSITASKPDPYAHATTVPLPFSVTVEATGQSINWVYVNSSNPQWAKLAATTSEGTIYAIGGNNGDGVTSAVDTYNPATDTWTSVTPMPQPLEDMGAATGPDGTIYVFGGDYSDDTFQSNAISYSPITNTWTSISPLPTGREYVAGATGPNGLIYAIGGFTGNNVVTNEVDAYNPSTSMWSTVAPLPVALGAAAATTGPDGKIYVIGGDASGTGDFSNAVYAYDTTTNMWTQVANLPDSVGYLSATTSGNGTIYAIGGSDGDDPSLDTVYAYDVLTNTWTTAPSINSNGDNSGAAATDGQGNVYSIGGYGFDWFSENQLLVGTTPTDSSSLELTVIKGVPPVTWNNPAGIFVGTTLSNTQLDATASIPGTFVYSPPLGTLLPAGTDQTLSVTFTPYDTLDYNTHTFTVSLNVEEPPPVVTTVPVTTTVGVPVTNVVVATFTDAGFPGAIASDFHATIAWGDGDTSPGVITADPNVAGQFDVTGTKPTPYSSASGRQIVVDVSAVTNPPAVWTPLTNMLYGNYAFGATVGSTDLIYVLGGGNTFDSESNAFTYNPTNGASALIPSLTNDRQGLGAATGLDGTIYAVGGASSSNYAQSEVDAYNPTTHVWSTLALLPTPLEYLSVVAGLNGDIYAFGGDGPDGTGDDGISDAAYAYDPTTNEWTTLAPMTHGREGMGAAVGPDGTIYLMGGFTYANGTTSEVDAYDPTTNTWTQVASLPRPMDQFGATSGPAGEIYAVGYPTFAYTPTTNTWTQVPVPLSLGYELAAVTGLDGTIYALGGYDGPDSLSGVESIAGPIATGEGFSSPTINKATPVITWATPAPISYGTALSNTQLDATTTIVGSWTYSPLSGTVVGGGDQTLAVTFTPTDTVDYNSATQTVVLDVLPAQVPYAWTPTNITYGTPLGANQLNAAPSEPGTVVYSPALGAILNAGQSETLHAVFTPTDTTDYAVTDFTTTINVAKQAVPITWNTPAPIAYGTPLSGTQLNAGATIPGTFVYTPAAGTVLNTGANQTLSVTFTPNDTVDYATETQTTTINVNTIVPVVSWTAPPAISYGTLLSNLELNATANIPGTWAYTPPVGTKLNVGSNQTLSATFTPTDVNDNAPVTITTQIDVVKATPVISWTPANITYGTLLGGSQLNATSMVPGTFVYTPPLGTLLNAGNSQVLSVTFTPTDTVDYNTTTTTALLNVAKASAVITWAAPAGLVYGTALSATQLNASSNVAGSFVYNPGFGAILNAGVQTLSVTYTPTDQNNYLSQTVTTTINVAKAVPYYQWSIAQPMTYGQPLSATQFNATANVPGNYRYDLPVGTVLNAGYGQVLYATFTPYDTNNYVSIRAQVGVNVLKASLTVSAYNLVSSYLHSNAPLNLNYQGFVNGDGPNNLTSLPVATSPVTLTSAPGVYTITVTGGSSSNYNITDVNGTYTVVAPSTGSNAVVSSVTIHHTAGKTIKRSPGFIRTRRK